MQLEDEFGDIISKAWKGLGMDIGEVSTKSGIPAESLEKFAAYSLKPTDEEIEKLALTLNLNYKSLLNISKNLYLPKEFDYKKAYEGVRIVPIKGSMGGYPVYAYLLIVENKCIIIDTADSPDMIIQEVKKNNLEPLFMLITHSHSDHIGGYKKIKDNLNINGYIHKSALFNSDSLRDLSEQHAFEVNSHRIEVIPTPGHTQDSVTYLVDKYLFIGDLIFAGSLGRGNWSYKELLESAKKILGFPEDYHIFPGHGPKTSVGEERENNAFVNF